MNVGWSGGATTRVALEPLCDVRQTLFELLLASKRVRLCGGEGIDNIRRAADIFRRRLRPRKEAWEEVGGVVATVRIDATAATS